MTVAGVAMFKDEADVIEATLRHMLWHVDFLVLADNMSTDGTLDILRGLALEFDGPISYIIDDDPAYYQSRKITELAQTARHMGADWVVPFDADEIWSSPMGMRVADILEAQAPETFIVHADVHDHVCTGIDYRDVSHPFHRMMWCTTAPLPLPKAALRLTEDLVVRAGNHGGDYDETRPTIGEYLSLDKLRVDHFPYRSPEQFVRKVRNGAAAYQATDLPEDTGTHWRNYGRILETKGPEVLVGDVFYRWFYEPDPARPINRHLSFSPVALHNTRQ
jgi:glycosyltransferase involved in cell wall biosynthesis